MPLGSCLLGVLVWSLFAASTWMSGQGIRNFLGFFLGGGQFSLLRNWVALSSAKSEILFLLAGANGPLFPILPLEHAKNPTPIAKPNLGCFSSCISIKRMYSLWWDYGSFLWRKKEPKFKSTYNLGSCKLKRRKGKKFYHSRAQDIAVSTVKPYSVFCLQLD